MVRLTSIARRLRRDQTDAEKLLWSKLRNRQFMGLKFRLQVVIENYVADFVCMERGLIIELDGGQHADCAGDELRSDVLRAKGFFGETVLE